MPLQSGGDGRAEPKLKGILKKSSSTQDVSAAGGLEGYVGSGRLLLDVAPLASTSSISSNNSSNADDVQTSNS